MLLSSCPGKKVRLKGPVKGRGAICRDLGTDLERIVGMGVRCIVCCLDDDELEFLGVKWTDYARLARQNGIDVLRVPMPEGLTPHSIPHFNYSLDMLIQQYTLRGIPVLVHCRGGVGRAGLVACCWMIKVGLCGWIESMERYTPPSQSFSMQIPELNDVPFVPSQRSPPGESDSMSNELMTSYFKLNASPDQNQNLNGSYTQDQDFSLIDISSLPTPISPTVTGMPANHFTSNSIPTILPTNNPNPVLSKTSPESLDLVQKAIAVVRRRRSVKAIETYEQVKFLVEFVDFLRSGSL